MSGNTPCHKVWQYCANPAFLTLRQFPTLVTARSVIKVSFLDEVCYHCNADNNICTVLGDKMFNYSCEGNYRSTTSPHGGDTSIRFGRSKLGQPGEANYGIYRFDRILTNLHLTRLTPLRHLRISQF